MPDAGESTKELTTPREPRVAIVGAGLAGICAAIFLREKLGLSDESIFGMDRHPEMGGNWYENTYPGLACDTPAPVYSFSFALNPSWSSAFPPQPELLAYIQSVGRKFEVDHLFTMNRKITRAEWNAEKGVWKISYVDLVNTGEPATTSSKIVEGSAGSFEADFLFNSTHSTNEPGLPLIPGAVEEVFEGKWWHSMRWPRDGLEQAKGKRVAMVGCAAAAIQLVPQLAKVAGYLAVFGRTPNHIVERPNDPYPEELKKKWRENPMELRLFRARFEQEFGAAWYETGFVRGAPWHTKYLESAKRNLDQLKDPELKKKLTPDFDLWCRRILFHNDFYPALNQDNVEYVSERIVRLEKDGIVTAKQDSRETVIDPTAPEVKREFDIVIYATGWAATGGKAAPFDAIGVDGTTFTTRLLNLDYGGPEDMEMQTYQGVMLDKFPNLFTPGNALGLPLYSVIAAIETHTNFAIEIIRHAMAHNLKAVSPSHAAVVRWCELIDELAKDTPTGTKADCSGYYAIRKANGTETRRIYFGGLPSTLGSIMNYPVWSDFETTKHEGGQRWKIPVPPVPNRLDQAYQGHIVV